MGAVETNAETLGQILENVLSKPLIQVLSQVAPPTPNGDGRT